MTKTEDRIKDIRKRMSNNYIFDELGEAVISMDEDMEWAIGEIESLIEDSDSEVHHIMRRVGTDVAVKEGLAESGYLIDALISGYLSDGWEIQSTHLIRVAKLDRQPSQRKRWWEFWKTSDGHEQGAHAFDLMWVLVR